MRVGPGGERVIKADDFFVDFLTTALEPTEILREIRIKTPTGKVWTGLSKGAPSCLRLCNCRGGRASANGADGSCEAAGVGITGVASKAYRAGAVEAALAGKHLDEADHRGRLLRMLSTALMPTPIYQHQQSIADIWRKCTRAVQSPALWPAPESSGVALSSFNGMTYLTCFARRGFEA